MKVSPNTAWDKALALIRENVSEQQFKTWFKPIAFESFNEQTKTVLVQVPSPFVYEYLEENYVDLLGKVLRRTFCEGVRLAYRVVTDRTNQLTQVLEGEQAGNGSEQAKRRANQSPTTLDSAQPQKLDPQLNPRQTFANFIEGDSNKLPRSVGMSIAEHPQTTQFNPMFIYGPSGCGKTHLANAIGNRIAQLYPQKRVLYVSA
ncbi:MAG: ATP-binding protein, partial [Prevotella sp.]|nr:ATP-binding protein [Prevotella sp.]